EAIVPTGVAIVEQLVELTIFNEGNGALEAAGEGIETADVTMEQIGRIERLATDLGVEIEAALAQTALLQDVVEGERHFPRIIGEVVGVPAGLQIVAVGVDRAEHAQRRGNSQLVFEGVACEEGVADLDIALHLLFEAVLLEEAKDRGDVVVVLVLGWFLRLGFDEDLAGEADLFGMLDDEVQEAGHLVLLLPDLGVEEGFVALAAAPEHIVLAAQFMGQLEHGFYLTG